MINAQHLIEFDNENADPTLQFWSKFAQLSENDIQFRKFILGIPESNDAIFMNIDLEKAKNICQVIEARIAAEAALVGLDSESSPLETWNI